MLRGRGNGKSSSQTQGMEGSAACVLPLLHVVYLAQEGPQKLKPLPGVPKRLNYAIFFNLAFNIIYYRLFCCL